MTKPKIDIDPHGPPVKRIYRTHRNIPWDKLTPGGKPVWYPFEEKAGTVSPEDNVRFARTISTTVSNRKRRFGGVYQTQRGHHPKTGVRGVHIWRVE